MDEDAIARVVIDCAFKIHTALGPGLLESVYEACMQYELNQRQLLVQKQVPVTVKYGDALLGIGYGIDLLIDRKVVIEVKCAEHAHPLHRAQLLSYLKLGRFKLGLLLKFNTIHMRHGIKRVVNGL
ncbi:MAG TPA: GxxExxY protein [Burkholderiales bacterium]